MARLLNERCKMFKRILVPLDGSPLAEDALPVAIRIAEQTNGKLTLLRAIELDPIVMTGLATFLSCIGHGTIF